MLHGHDHSIFLHLPRSLAGKADQVGCCRTITSLPADVAP
jgi:hypothetical protein